MSTDQERLAKLETLAKKSSFPAERELAAAKAKALRAKIAAMRPRRGQREHVSVHIVDVSDTTTIKDAFRKAFGAAFSDIKRTMRAEGTSKPSPRSDPKAAVKRMGMKVRYK